jgi:hypothetical protein
MSETDIGNDVLGKVPWHPAHGCWGACVDIGGGAVPFTVFRVEGGTPPIDLATAVVSTLRTDERRFRKYAADELLGCYNNDWRRFTGDDLRLDDEAFIARLTLQSIVTHPYRFGAFGAVQWEVLVRYDAAGMFGLHAVMIVVEEGLRFRAAQID